MSNSSNYSEEAHYLSDGVTTQALLEDVDAEVVLVEGLNVSDLVGAEIEIAETVKGTGVTEDITLVTNLFDGNAKVLFSADQDMPLENNSLVGNPNYVTPQSLKNSSCAPEVVVAENKFVVTVGGIEGCDAAIVTDLLNDNDKTVFDIDPVVQLDDTNCRDDPDYIPPQSDQTSFASSNDEESNEVLLGNMTSATSPNHENETRQKRKRNRKAVSADWEKNKIKKLRMHGQKYTGYERKRVNDKMVVSKANSEREERKIGPRCNSKVCMANKKRKCSEFTEVERANIFKKFWELSWKEKEVLVCSSVTLSLPKVRTCKGPSRRKGTVTYRLKHEGTLKPVCKRFFLNTLDLGEWTALNWIKNNDSCSTENTREAQEMDAEARDEDIDNIENSAINNIPTVKRRSAVKTNSAREWLDKLPKLPSHYTRKDTSKSYLEPVWESKSALYREYKRYSVENEKPCASLALFFDLFEEMKLSIHIPRKDQCDKCCSYKTGNISKDVWDKHQSEKTRARLEKDNDKLKAENGEIFCLNADVQAVKVTPMVKASALYYKTKLCSHNFSVFNVATHQCTCYWFNESEGDLTGNTFASCIYDYLEEKCLDPKLPIVLYTDGCTPQNRNQVLSNALLNFSVKHQVQVVQKFLIKGHTQMEGDSVHAMIENKLKNKDIYVPYEFVKYTKEARMKPFPYDAKYLKHDFFKDYSKLEYYRSIRPGRKTGDPVVTDIHCLKYDPAGVIQYKLQFDDEYKDIPRRPSKVCLDIEIKKLHTARLSIQASKFKHLQELKAVIPEDYHSFYDNLPHL